MSRIEDQLAEALAEELSDLLGNPWNGRVHIGAPPQGPVAGASFAVSIQSGGSDLRVELPCGLAIGYLADEESAVDAWKGWTEELALLLGRRAPA